MKVSIVKEENRLLRKKIKRVEDSRSNIKAKNRDKAKKIKASKDRMRELEENRDQWKCKCKDLEKENGDLRQKYQEIADGLGMPLEQFREILKQFEESKKKYPEKSTRIKKR